MTSTTASRPTPHRRPGLRRPSIRRPRVAGILVAAIVVAGASYGLSLARPGATSAPRSVAASPAAPAAPVEIGIPGSAAAQPAAGSLAQIDHSIAAWTKNLADNPTDYLSATNLATLYHGRGRLTADLADQERALEATRTALRVVPTDASARLLEASIQFTIHDFEAALATASALYADDPTQLAALATRADAELELGRVAAATADYADRRRSDERAGRRRPPRPPRLRHGRPRRRGGPLAGRARVGGRVGGRHRLLRLRRGRVRALHRRRRRRTRRLRGGAPGPPDGPRVARRARPDRRVRRPDRRRDRRPAPGGGHRPAARDAGAARRPPRRARRDRGGRRPVRDGPPDGPAERARRVGVRPPADRVRARPRRRDRGDARRGPGVARRATRLRRPRPRRVGASTGSGGTTPRRPRPMLPGRPGSSTPASCSTPARSRWPVATLPAAGRSCGRRWRSGRRSTPRPGRRRPRSSRADAEPATSGGAARAASSPRSPIPAWTPYSVSPRA